ESGRPPTMRSLSMGGHYRIGRFHEVLMLDLTLLRERPDEVAKALRKRGLTSALDEFAALDTKRRALITETESLKRQRNESSKKIGEIMKAKGDATSLREETKALGDKIAAREADLATIDTDVQHYL